MGGVGHGVDRVETVLTPEEKRELDALERRVYAPGDTASEADRARLGELEQKRREGASGAGLSGALGDATNAEVPRAASSTVGETYGRAVAAAPGADGAGNAQTEVVDSLPWDDRLRLRRPRIVLGAALVVALVGFAVGVAFPRPSEGEALTDSQSQRRVALVKEHTAVDVDSVALLDVIDLATDTAQLSSNDGDASALAALGPAEREVLLWAMTESNGEYRCLGLDVPGKVTKSCQRADSPWSSEMSVQWYGKHFLGDAADLYPDAPDAQSIYVTAVALFGDEGEAFGQVTLRDATESGYSEVSHFRTADENAEAARLVDEWGLSYDPQLVGYADELPVWSGMRASGEQCLLVIDDDVVHSDCSSVGGQGLVSPDTDLSVEEVVVLSILLPARADRAAMLIEQHSDTFRSPWLTITREGSPYSAWLVPTER